MNTLLAIISILQVDLLAGLKDLRRHIIRGTALITKITLMSMIRAVVSLSPVSKKTAEPVEQPPKKDDASFVPYPSVTKVSSTDAKEELRAKLEPVDEMEGLDPAEKPQERDSSVSEEDEKIDSSDLRASPGLFLSIDEDGNVEAMPLEDEEMKSEIDPVEDIAMSPIPYDHEDPASLMDLPSNLLCLPISPCGPNDDPLQTD
ncbi:MAG: hypothetical protein SGARI_000497 [Bacillariaceae sp.]